FAARQPRTVADVGDVSSALVRGSLSYVSDGKRRRLAVNASVLRVVNRDVLRIVSGNDDADDEFDWLVSQPFMKDTERGRAYRDEIRPQLVRRLRLDAPQGIAELHRRLADYYRTLIEATAGEDESWRNRQWQSNALEGLYHRLAAAPAAELKGALNGFVRAFAADRRSFAHRYAETVQQVGVELEVETLRKLGDRLVAGLAALDTGGEAARQMFTSLLEGDALEPRWRAKALDWRGYLLTRADRYADAKVDLDAAVALEPGSAEYRVDRAVTLQQLGRHDEALADLDVVLAAAPDNAAALLVRAFTRQLTGRNDEALGDVRKVVAAEPNNTAALLLEANLLQSLGSVNAAIERLDEAAKRLPTEPRIHASRARMLAQVGRTADALAALDRADELAPGDYGL